MKDMRAYLDKLREDAADCAVIAGLAENREKRALFSRLAEHLTVLAGEVEVAIKVQLSGEEGDPADRHIVAEVGKPWRSPFNHQHGHRDSLDAGRHVPGCGMGRALKHLCWT